jgi:hypothetical protein
MSNLKKTNPSGTKKLVCGFGENGDKKAENTSFNNLNVEYKNVDGFMLLDNSKRDEDDLGTIHIDKCFCTDCKKAFDINKDMQGIDATYNDECGREHRNDNTSYVHNLWNDDMRDIECPDCHKTIETFAFIDKNQDTKDWTLPNAAKSRRIYEYRDNDGKLTRFDDNLILAQTTVYESGECDTKLSKYSQITDLEDRSIKYKQVDLLPESTPKTVAVTLENDPFVYNDRDKTAEFHDLSKRNALIDDHSYDRPDIKNTQINNVCDMSNERFTGELRSNHHYYLFENKSLDYGQLHEGLRLSQWQQLGTYMQDVKAKLLEEQFDNFDSATNCVYLENKFASSERSSSTDHELKSMYMYMMTMYPAATEYAANTAYEKIENYERTQAEKAANDPTYHARTLDDYDKSMIWRNQMKHTASQLCAVDDDLLETIRNSKDAADMKEQLKAAYLSDTSSKKAIQDFDTNPIGVANTVYTLNRFGVNDEDSVNRVLDNVDYITDHGYYAEHDGVQSGTIYPIQCGDESEFIRKYIDEYGSDIITDIYTDNDTFAAFKESAEEYKQAKELDHSNAVARPDAVRNMHDKLLSSEQEVQDHADEYNSIHDTLIKEEIKNRNEMRENALDDICGPTTEQTTDPYDINPNA